MQNILMDALNSIQGLIKNQSIEIFTYEIENVNGLPKEMIKNNVLLLNWNEAMNNFKIPTDIEKEAKNYMTNVVNMLEDNGLMQDVDNAALTMLARNYSMFIKASKQLEKDGLTVVSDRGNIAPHPAIKIAKDAQT